MQTFLELTPKYESWWLLFNIWRKATWSRVTRDIYSPIYWSSSHIKKVYYPKGYVSPVEEYIRRHLIQCKPS